MAVWLKVALLLMYLAVLFILTRFLETVIWYEQDQISRRLLDPMALSVLRLKALLEQRGVSYDNMVEKKELTDLVEASGPVNEEELESAAQIGLEENIPITNYTSDIDFYEQVEDAKDSMWLVEIIAQEHTLLSDTSWHAIRKKVGKFGVRMGKFDCQKRVTLCMKKGWYTSRLVLALPENYQSKANVAIYTYSGPIRVNSLFSWIKSRVNQQVQTIEDKIQLQNNWLTFPSSLSPDVRLLFISTLSSVPLFLSALSVKFPGRVKVGHIKLSTERGKNVAQKLDLKSTPAYAIMTEDHVYLYGLANGEIMSFKAMEIFLKTVYPNMNDIFIISIIFTNIAACFEFSLSKGGFVRRLIKLLLCMFQYNIVLLLVWIILLGLLQLPLFEHLSLIGLKALRMCTLTNFFTSIRKDILNYSQNLSVPLAALFSMNVIVSMFSRLFRNEADDEDEEADWWNFSNLRTLNYYNGWEMMRLRPFDQIFNPSFGGQNDIEEYRNVTVNSDEYIKFLPVWVYKKPECLCQCVKNENSNKSMDKNAERRQGLGYNKHGQNDEKSDLGNTERINEEDFETENEYNEQLAASFLDSNYCCECQRNQTPRPTHGNSHSHDNSNSHENSRPHDFAHQSSRIPLAGQHQGSSFENPWNGQPHSNRFKTIENLNSQDKAPVGYLEDSQCVICLESYKDFVLLRGLPCRHVFHDKCILTWLTRENHFCPVCRWPSFQLKEWTVPNNLHND